MSALRHTWLAFPSMAGGLAANARRDCTRSVPARARLGRWEKLTGGNWQPRQDLVAGLVPRASGIDDPDLARAVGEREDAIARDALWTWPSMPYAAVLPWAKAFGPPPPRPGRRPGLVGPPGRGRRLPGPLAHHRRHRASSARRGMSARSPKPPTAPGRSGPGRKLLAWPAWLRRRQPRR